MSEQAGNNQDSMGKNWHLDKTISVTHIFSTIAAVSALVVLGSRFDTRITVLENSVIQERQANIQQDEATATFKRDMKDDLRDIASKLDRLILKDQT